MSTNKAGKLEKTRSILGAIAAASTLLSIAFGVGYWKCSIDRRLDAMEEKQRHNEEIANIKIEHNRQLMETKEELNKTILQLQTEIHYLKAKNNDTKRNSR